MPKLDCEGWHFEVTLNGITQTLSRPSLSLVARLGVVEILILARTLSLLEKEKGQWKPIAE